MIKPLLVSKKEARVLLGNIPNTTFDRWIHKGVLTPVRLKGTHVRFRLNEIEKIAGCKAEIKENK